MERTYTTVDKSEWGDGPWQDEPDKVQWKDEATGLPCLAKRHGRAGHWCGYVGVPEGHPAFGKDYDDVRVATDDGWPDAHGGLTYAAHCQEGDEAEAICHIPDPGEPDHVWWLGFDCAHSGDLSPGYAALDRKRYEETGDSLWLSRGSYESYRDLRYVRGVVRRLAGQLAEAVVA